MLGFVSLHRIALHVDRVLPLAKIVEAHGLLQDHSQQGKIVLLIKIQTQPVSLSLYTAYQED